MSQSSFWSYIRALNQQLVSYKILYPRCSIWLEWDCLVFVRALAQLSRQKWRAVTWIPCFPTTSAWPPYWTGCMRILFSPSPYWSSKPQRGIPRTKATWMVLDAQLRICFYCGKPDHQIHRCPERASPSQVGDNSLLFSLSLPVTFHYAHECFSVAALIDW